MFDDHVPEPKRSRWVTVMLLLLPAWLLGSGGLALWMYFHQAKKDAQVEMPRSAAPIDATEMDATMTKILRYIGERNSSSVEAAKGLKGIMSTIDGSLGPGNTGYHIERIPTTPVATGAWPIIMVQIRGKNEDAAPLVVVAPCDSVPGSTGAVDNASGVVATMAVARAMADVKPERTIVFAFIPHALDPAGPVDNTAKALKEALPTNAENLLVVQRLGVGEAKLTCLSQAATNPLAGHDDLANAKTGARGEYPLADRLADLKLPVAVLTSAYPPVPLSPDDAAPDSKALAESASQLQSVLWFLANRK